MENKIQHLEEIRNIFLKHETDRKKGEIILDKSLSSFCSKKIKWDTSKITAYIANMEAANKIVELIRTFNAKNILNLGTGCGFSAFTALYGATNTNGRVVSLDHIPQFNERALVRIEEACQFAGIKNQIELRTCKLISLKKKHVDVYKKILSNPIINKFLSTNKRIKKVKRQYGCKDFLFCYDTIVDEKYDFVIIDGPPISRIATLFAISKQLNDNAIILFELCIMEVELLHIMGFSSYMNHSGPIERCNFSPYTVYPVTWIKFDDDFRLKSGSVF